MFWFFLCFFLWIDKKSNVHRKWNCIYLISFLVLISISTSLTFDSSLNHWYTSFIAMACLVPWFNLFSYHRVFNFTLMRCAHIKFRQRFCIPWDSSICNMILNNIQSHLHKNTGIRCELCIKLNSNSFFIRWVVRIF